MAQSTIAIIILVAALVMYAIPQIPLPVTTLLAMVAMVFAGILDFATASSGFSNQVIFLIVAFFIIGQAMVDTGLARRAGNMVTRLNLGDNKTKLIIVVFVVSTVLAVFLNGSIVVSVLMPIIDAIILESKGKVTRKDTYFVLGLGSVLGNNVLTISATSMLTAVSLLVDMGYDQMSVFAPVAINLPAVVLVIVFYALVGVKLQDRWFNFPEIPVEASNAAAAADDAPAWKRWMVGLTFLGVVIAMVAGANYGLVSIIGTIVLLITKCIPEKTAWRSVSWGTVVVVAGAIGFSNGIKASGAGEVIADFFIRIAGPLGESGLGMCAILFFVASIISDVMSDNACVAIMLPIAAAVAERMGISAVPIFMAVCSGTKVGLATPICVTPMTQVGAAGYRFIDYVRMGGLVNVICWVVSTVMIGIVYF